MFPGTPIDTSAPPAEGQTASGESVTISAASLQSALASAGYVKASDVSRIVNETLNTVAAPAKFVPPAVWDPINVDDIDPPALPYMEYTAPIKGGDRPDMLSSESRTLGGSESYGGPTLGDGVAGPLYERLQKIRDRIRGDAEGPPEIPFDVEGLDATLSMFGIRLDDLEKNAVALPLLDPLKGGILDNFDSLTSLARSPNNGLEAVINRLDKCCISNNRYSKLIRTALLRIVLRTDDLNEILNELANELKGVRVIAGLGTPFETVQEEAERLAKYWAQNYATGTLAQFLGGLIFVHEADNWFDAELAQRDILTGASIDGFDLIRQPFLKGGVVDNGRAGALKILLDNEFAILDATPKARSAYDAIFLDTVTIGTSSFTGLMDAVKNFAAEAGVGLPDADSISGDWITKLMNRAIGITPLNALPPFFRDIVNVRNLDLAGAGNAQGLLNAQFEKLSGLFGTMQDDMHDRDYMFTYDIVYRDPLGVADVITVLGYFRQTGLAGFVANATKHIKDLADTNQPAWSTDANKLNEIRKAGKELATWYSKQAEGAFNDIAKSFGYSGTGAIKGVDFTTGDWNPNFNTGLDKIDTAIDALPVNVPTGFEMV